METNTKIMATNTKINEVILDLSDEDVNLNTKITNLVSSFNDKIKKVDDKMGILSIKISFQLKVAPIIPTDQCNELHVFSPSFCHTILFCWCFYETM